MCTDLLCRCQTLVQGPHMTRFALSPSLFCLFVPHNSLPS
ncbi:hypothetical protein COLO4_10071 [Corchorus olitorius]|uniref:Uncharacterized protein n=1 Tax=Corchorus olitorius TaxID=93759 RepID=A0A1R3KA25_9ROSI|nr:hypothetical protein COLO4_34370 [Corchorus olitorius]OMP03955.1 hypothetical protein COLO4_10071 [Corchorus olitorius]